MPLTGHYSPIGDRLPRLCTSIKASGNGSTLWEGVTWVGVRVRALAMYLILDSVIVAMDSLDFPYKLYQYGLESDYCNNRNNSEMKQVGKQTLKLQLNSVMVKVVSLFVVLTVSFGVSRLQAAELPVADAHIHYSHDSVELTPPARVIELMREANLKFALVSSSDDNGTQLLSELAPDLIVPGLRPYRRRGETGTWFNDPEALVYVEKLLAKNRYASIGEFHLFGDSADLAIPRRIVELADEYNLILHAHSDADAVERLLAQSPTVKVLWAHSGFDTPDAIAAMLEKHDRLWADLAFRSEVGSGGSLSDDWLALFKRFPDRLMLGTDTYTPERIYFIPHNASASRTWLSTLPAQLAENIAWKNAFNLIIPVWNENRAKDDSALNDKAVMDVAARYADCTGDLPENSIQMHSGDLAINLISPVDIKVSEAFPVRLAVCGKDASAAEIILDATMPRHGHGMNYQPEHAIVTSESNNKVVDVSGLVLHMPGQWQWAVKVKTAQGTATLNHDFIVD